MESSQLGYSERWKLVRLGDIAELNPKIPARETIDDELAVQFVPMKAVEEVSGKTALDQVRRYGDVKKSYTSFINGDVLFAKVTPCMENGKIAVAENLTNGIGLGSSEFHVIRPSKELCNKFLFFFLVQKKFRNEAQAAMTGAVGLRRVPKQFIENYVLPLPPITEQHRIVAKIEELLSELDAGRQALEQAAQQLKLYRQAVLKWAFEGRLTNEIAVDGELPEGWRWEVLNELCEKIQDGSHFSPQIQFSEPGDDRYKYITAKNIRNGYMDLSSVGYVDKDFHESIYGRCNPEYGDVLLTKDGVNAGEVTLNTLHEPFSLLSSVCIFKPYKRRLSSSYLQYFFQSPQGNLLVKESMTGTAIKRIILRKIRAAEIVIPSHNEQLKIVQQIENCLSICNKIEDTINQSIHEAEVLRQSILKKAFEGRLIEAATNARAIPLPKPVRFYPNIRKAFAAQIIAQCHKDRHFGMVVFQKTLHIAEYFCQVDYETYYAKHAAGPMDTFIYDLEEEASSNSWFEMNKSKKQHRFTPKSQLTELVEEHRPELLQFDERLQKVLQFMMNRNMDEAELFSTIYAVWNNCLIENTPPTRERIIDGVHEWHERKARFSDEQIWSAKMELEVAGLVPAGFGKVILLASPR